MTDPFTLRQKAEPPQWSWQRDMLHSTPQRPVSSIIQFRFTHSSSLSSASALLLSVPPSSFRSSLLPLFLHLCTFHTKDRLFLICSCGLAVWLVKGNLEGFNRGVFGKREHEMKELKNGGEGQREKGREKS
jgi:hypothetical protein